MKATDFISLHKKHFSFKEFVRAALQEDAGDGDHTSLATINKNQQGQMVLRIKEAGIIAGIEAAKIIFKIADKKIKFKKLIEDGARVKPGDEAFIVSGNTQMLLTTERLVLNVMQRMSGIATHTALLMKLCEGTNTKVIDTRKTTPLFRFFEKWAVLIGGGANHRYGLFDMVLIKDNHIDFAGGVSKAIDKSSDYLHAKKLKLKIEVEARTFDDVKEIIENGKADRVLLDNFSPAQVKKAVQFIKGRIVTEASGGINQKNIRSYAEAGVDYISVGALTHHVRSLDISLKYQKTVK